MQLLVLLLMIFRKMLYLKGGLEQIPNFFHYGNINVNTSKRNESKWHDQVITSVFASAELGWNHQLYLTVTGRNDWHLN